MRQTRGLVEIDTQSKRSRLPADPNPYWANVVGRHGGLSLGYRKSARKPGSWVAKAVYRGRRFEETFAVADDKAAPESALGFAGAKAWVLDWGRQKSAQVEAEIAEGVASLTPTVASVCREYVAARTDELGEGSKPKTSIKKHVLTDTVFSAIKMSKLKVQDIKDWRKRLSNELEPSTVNRILNDVRAALNMGAETHQASMPAHLARTIKSGTKAVPLADVARQQVLEDEQVQSTISASYEVDVDFGDLTLTKSATGARFSQIARIKVRDLQLGPEPRLMVPVSRKGKKGEKSRKNYAVVIGDDVAGILGARAKGRDPDEPLLMRWEKKQVGPFLWEKTQRVEWKPSTTATYWEKTVKLAGLPPDTVMYALRHSSIIRNLRANLPMRLVAALHDTSTSQIEKYYAAFIIEITDELARRAIVPMAPARLKVPSIPLAVAAE